MIINRPPQANTPNVIAHQVARVPNLQGPPNSLVWPRAVPPTGARWENLPH
jgi:hypothetical protein